MSPEPDGMPASQLARWLTVGVLILAAVLLYFREGTRLPPLGHSPAAADTLSSRTTPDGR